MVTRGTWAHSPPIEQLVTLDRHAREAFAVVVGLHTVEHDALLAPLQNVLAMRVGEGEQRLCTRNGSGLVRGPMGGIEIPAEFARTWALYGTTGGDGSERGGCKAEPGDVTVRGTHLRDVVVADRRDTNIVVHDGRAYTSACTRSHEGCSLQPIEREALACCMQRLVLEVHGLEVTRALRRARCASDVVHHLHRDSGAMRDDGRHADGQPRVLLKEQLVHLGRERRGPRYAQRNVRDSREGCT